MNEASIQIGRATLHRSCARLWLPAVPDASADFVFTDPPYPCIRREYGFMDEASWFDLMRCVVPHCMRILKPTGSAVFVLQPSGERCGRMRTWLWEFMAWVGREWGIVQDVYWWNFSALPVTEGIKREVGLMRPSVKYCVWVGPEKCYRDQSAILWEESDRNKAMRQGKRFKRVSPSGREVDNVAMGEAAVERGGVTPFNLWPIGGCNRWGSGIATNHGASTPLELTRKWIDYACPPGGTVIDPFFGSGTTAYAALQSGRSFRGCEVMASYYDAAAEYLKDSV